MVTFDMVRENPGVNAYIRGADKTLVAMGYTEHSFAHVCKTANEARGLLSDLGYDARLCELAGVAGYLHDIGNVINRENHAQTGAVMAFRLLDRMYMDADEIALIISAIGNHDEKTAEPVNAAAAALILADKCDVRRSRVRNTDFSSFDIHDRVNYAAEKSELLLDKNIMEIMLRLTIDTDICPVIDYFEIFLGRMLLCRRAADFLKTKFRLTINESVIL